MMEKAKNKQIPINTRRYWIGLSILFLLLLMPFRFTTYIGEYPTLEGNLTIWTYRLISLCIFLFGLKFIFTHKLRRMLLTVFIIACLGMSLYQTNNNIRGSDWHCTYDGYVHISTGASEWDGIIFEPVWCTPHILGACCWIEYVKLKYIPITIKADWFQSLSPNAEYQNDL